MFKKGLATLVILLFLGLAVSPSIYADLETPLEDDITIYEEEDCGCIDEETLEWNSP